MITTDSSSESAFQAILNGACECLEKPVRPQTLKRIWQCVLRKRKNEFLYRSSAGREPSCSNPKARRGEEEEEEEEEGEGEQEQCGKKQRFIWTDIPHQIFVDAVNSLTLESKFVLQFNLYLILIINPSSLIMIFCLINVESVPKKILEYMRSHGVPNITRAIVASHLQV